jgi:7-carboxy-7-deazaguanine synthase
MKYKINEIFYSIQGEGFYSGTAAIFIRFSGCNLKCDFCDTDHSQKMSLTKEQIFDEIKKYESKHIIFTGGEPTLQINKDLCLYLKEKGYFLSIESNGTNKVDSYIDWITISPKNEDLAQKTGNELKVVFETIDLENLTELNFNHFYIQPKSEQNINEIIKYIKKNPIWKLSIQIQKILKVR